MSFGVLSEHFSGVSVKKLSEVEVDPGSSNQHELGTNKRLRNILGTPENGDTWHYNTELIYLDESQDKTVSDSLRLSYYDSRRNKPERSPEYRLYYPENTVIRKARAGDTLFIGVKRDSSFLMVITPQGSTAEKQLLWLFGFSKSGKRLTTRNLFDEDIEISTAGQFLLNELNIEVEEQDDVVLGQLLDEFGTSFPSTRVFSEFARSMLPDINPVENPDLALSSWFDREWKNFRILERHIVSEKLSQGFGGDVDQFLSYSLSVQNRRKARAGLALENHLEQLLVENRLNYSREEVTENNNKPDFLFPGIQYYRLPAFPQNRLTILGAKTTCKDRWRQVMPEAERIDKTYLLTLEPAISENQTSQMQNKLVQLVVPSTLFDTYTDNQKGWLMNLNGFLGLVKNRQNSDPDLDTYIN
ncbi:type II restriction endonuclease [Fodinibius sp. AD559]|uniref:type II restriction endonuclease n=1 Tax=Fodinibius sp. AD559 TaxID=3424179 RepID=UPI0040470417